MSRLGILGGTFDPPHYGHLILAEQAREQLVLDRVLWLPAADPPHKQDRMISGIDDRLAMLAFALADNPAFEVSLVDVRRPGPHFTIDTLDLLAAEFPGAELLFLIGGDSLEHLLSWRDPRGIVRRACLGVMQRPGARYDLTHLEAAIPGLRNRLIIINAPLIEISGADIRDRVRARRSIRYFLPPRVEAYIYERGLYQPA